MITTYAFIQPAESPSDAKASLEAMLAAQEVTGATVYLQRVDVNGYFFSIEAEDGDQNLATLQSLCGTLNTTERGPATPALNLRAVGRLWKVAGGEGRFAAEHPPPPDAK